MRGVRGGMRACAGVEEGMSVCFPCDQWLASKWRPSSASSTPTSATCCRPSTPLGVCSVSGCAGHVRTDACGVCRKDGASDKVQPLYTAMQNMAALVHDAHAVIDKLRAQLSQATAELQDQYLFNDRNGRQLSLLIARVEAMTERSQASHDAPTETPLSPAQVDALVRVAVTQVTLV